MPKPRTLPTRDELVRLNPRLVERIRAKIGLGNAAANECWVWRGDGGHRPCVSIRLIENGRPETHYASRVAFVLDKGHLRAGASVLHHCDNDQCVNPSHLHCGGARVNAWERRHAAQMHAKIPMLNIGNYCIPHSRLWAGWGLPADYVAVYDGRLREYEAQFHRDMEGDNVHAA